MHKTLLVLRTEIVNVITRRSFLIMTFGVPLIGLVLFMGITSLNQTNPGSSTVIKVYDGDPAQPITTAPTIGKHQYESGYMVYFGTGSLLSLQQFCPT